MSDAMDWSQDFCLSCDNVNPTDGPYCSEACRLLDSDKSTESAVSHTAFYSQSYTPTTSKWTVSNPRRSSGMYLPPAVDFSALRTPSHPAGTVSLPQSPTNGSYFAANSGSKASSGNRHHHSHSTSKRSLTTSSSRSSLSSISTSSSSHGLSDQTITQLRNYVNSFDHTRDLKRRQTLA